MMRVLISDSKNGNVTDADYQLVGRQGRGKAQEIELGR